MMARRRRWIGGRAGEGRFPATRLWVWPGRNPCGGGGICKNGLQNSTKSGFVCLNHLRWKTDMVKSFKPDANATMGCAGDLLSAIYPSNMLATCFSRPEDTTTVELIDFHIYREFAGNGIGTKVINKLQDLLRERGFVAITGICKSYDRSLAKKEKLAQWYLSLGFTLVRESMEGEPGYIGKLTKNIKSAAEQ